MPARSHQTSADRSKRVVPPKRPFILVLAADAWETGGIGTFTRLLIDALVDSFPEAEIELISVWGRRPASPPAKVREPSPGADPATGPRVPYMRAFQMVVAAVATAAKHRDRSVVITTHAHLSPVAWAASRVARCSFAVWAHGYEVWAGLSFWRKLAIRRAGLVVAVSRFTALRAIEAQGLKEARVCVIYHGLRYLPAPPALERPKLAGTVLAVARLDRANLYKGVDALLKAWPAVLEAVPLARLEIVGDGSSRKDLELLAKELNITDRVEFLGWIDDAALGQLYETRSIFALPGRASTTGVPYGEGFGLVFLEAAAAGMAVVAGRCGGAAEAVRNHETGLLVDPRDGDAITQALLDLLQNPARTRQYGQKGRQMVETHYNYNRFKLDIAGLVRTLLRSAEFMSNVNQAAIDGGHRTDR